MRIVRIESNYPPRIRLDLSRPQSVGPHFLCSVDRQPVEKLDYDSFFWRGDTNEAMVDTKLAATLLR